MSNVMKAVVVDGKGGIEVVERPVPTPAAGEVLIAPQASGICGTDLHLIAGRYEHGRYPVTPGHEFAGYVAATGAGVTNVREGDFVGVDPNLSCGRCRWCRSSAKTLCPELRAFGVSLDGSCAEYVVVPDTVTYRLSDSLDPATGALVEPLSCVLHAVERTPDWDGSHVLVFGAGPIGLIVVAAARHLGAGPIAVVEPHQRRRDLAVQMGAEVAVQSADELTDREQVDIAVDASGHPAAIQDALDLLGRRGRLVQMGVAHEADRVSLSPYQVFAKELIVIGSHSLADAYPRAVDAMVDLAATLRPLVTDQLGISEYPQAVQRASSPNAIKVQVVPD